MISQIELYNYRCFNEHTIKFQFNNIVVGQNNAGKSTLIEALRLVSLVGARYKNLKYVEAPKWMKVKDTYGVMPSLRNMEFNFKSVYHRYGKPPAIIKLKYDTGELINIYIGPDEEIFACIFDNQERLVSNQKRAKQLELPNISILPQISPLLKEETILRSNYVQSSLYSSLESMHFRNQLVLYPEYFEEFKQIAESTWKGLRIREVENNHIAHGEKVSLFVQDSDFTAEIGWMGHGLQMWLQIIWFLARSTESDTIILDEPDVYMHADLQRKLINLLLDRYKQTIVTTHSVEIMAEVEPENILIIDKTKNESVFAASLPSVQKLIYNIGGIHNIQLARLWSSRKCLFIEGKDIAILKFIHKTLFPESNDSFESIPNMQIGGWGGWNYAIGSSMFMKNSSNQNIMTYCIFDRDYHTQAEILKRKEEANEKNIELFIWTKKEIENYLIVPDAIERLIRNHSSKNTSLLSKTQIMNVVNDIIDKIKVDIEDAIATEILANNKANGLRSANTEARVLVENAWKTFDGKLAIASGKYVISQLSLWSQEKYGVSFSSRRIAKELRKEEIHKDIVDVLTAIELKKPFSN